MGVKRLVLVGLAALVVAPSAAAESWFPHPKDAEWTYEWSDSVFSRAPAKEKVTVKSEMGRAFVLDWTTQDQGNAEEAPIGIGQMSFQVTTSGLINTDWQITVPPSEFPILCGAVARCGNSLASTLYLLIWGNRAPVLAEPLLRGASWASTGGVENDVTSVSQYLGREAVTVPAFPQPVIAAKVRSDITQAGALGDPYGSGVRTVWWVYGVGPVKILFEHAGGADAAVTTSMLLSTNQTPAMPPPDANYFPLESGTKQRFRWRNSKHMKQFSVQEFEIEQAVNNSARFAVKHIKGPIRVAGTYGFTLRTDGLTNIWGVTQAASLAKFPALGPRSVPPARQRHFFTPFDLMVYGTNPIMPAYASAGETWRVKVPSRDFSVFGATGNTRILGLRTVKVPAGRFRALGVQSKLRQKGFPFGSGTRTAYYAPGRGLVKLVFRHGDRSVSTVERLR